MWRRSLNSSFCRGFSSSSSASSNTEIPSLYSFLQPSLFSVKLNTCQQPQNQAVNDRERNPITEEQKSTLESNLHRSLTTQDTDEAWKSFKSIASHSSLPSKHLTNSLIAHLSSLHSETQNLKRAFASAAYVMEKEPKLLDFQTVRMLLESMKAANAAAPAFALVKCMFRNRYYMPLALWAHMILDICRNNGGFGAFLKILKESCRIAVDEKLDVMKPDLVVFNAALEGCCKCLESVSEAESVVEMMAVLGVRPDESSLGYLAYLYASKGLRDKIGELERIISGFDFASKSIVKCNLISGFVKLGDLQNVTAVVLQSVTERNQVDFGKETYNKIVRGFLENRNIKELASLVVEAQKLESLDVPTDRSVGFGIVSACVDIGLLDKAHSVVEEMNAQGVSVCLGVYVPILKAYCKEHRTAEATQLVIEISGAGLQLDAEIYDALIEVSMTNQDFQSAFTLFRDMREARLQNLKESYLTIMTGLLENQRPELMAAFLDGVIEDPRIEVKSHDWNSIIHAFCKSGRLEDARRTFRRMVFLRFEPNNQTYLSLINGYVTGEKYFNVLLLWNEVKRKISAEGAEKVKFDHALVDAFLYALVKGGFFDAVMQVVDKSQEMKVFVDKWRYKHAFMEAHKKLKVSKLRKRNLKKMEALVSFKNWAGLNTD